MRGFVNSICKILVVCSTLLRPARPPSFDLYPPTVLIDGAIRACTHPSFLYSSSQCRPQTHADNYKASHMIVLKAYNLNCVWQGVFDSVGVRGGWGWWMAFTGSKPLPPLSIFLSHLSDFSPWGFGSQHTNTLHCYCIVISIYKSYMNNGQKGKVECRFYHLQDNFLWFSMSD